MLFTRNYAVIVLFTLVYFFQDGYGIICWVCRSDDNPMCGDPFDNSSIIVDDCEQRNYHIPGVRPTMCKKIRQNVNGELRYVRGCAYLEEPGIEVDCLIRNGTFCLMRNGANKVTMEYWTCNTNGCNTASLAALSAPAGAVLIATLMFR